MKVLHTLNSWQKIILEPEIMADGELKIQRLRKMHLASWAVLAATVITCPVIMEVVVRMVLPQHLVRDYVVADIETGGRLQKNADYHDLYGNDYYVRTNGAGV